MTDIDIAVRPARKTLRQAAIILNVSIKTVRRMADANELQWNAGQITVESIAQYLKKSNGRRKKDENDEEIGKKIQQAIRIKQTGRRIISKGIE